jgi:hypothetical protein
MNLVAKLDLVRPRWTCSSQVLCASNPNQAARDASLVEELSLRIDQRAR